MKKLILLSIIMALPLNVHAKNKLKNIPIEKGAQINEEMRENSKLLQSLARSVKHAGYRCDSISAAKPFVMTRGYTLNCNKSAYEYNIREHAGETIITID